MPVHTRFYPAFEPAVISETGDTRVIRDENGIVQQVAKNRTAFPRFLKHPVENLSDFNALKERLDPDTPAGFPRTGPRAPAL